MPKDEKKELDRLMREIAQGEERKNQINILFQTQQLTQEELKILGKELQQLSLELEQKEARRLELSECIYE